MTRFPFERALVTGATGFVGANLAQALERAGVAVHLLVRPSSNRWRLDAMRSSAVVHLADLADASRVADVIDTIQPDVVFHAAAASAHHPVSAAGRQATLTDTVLGTLNLCEALANRRGCRLIYLGSSLEYERAADPLSETAPVRPTTFRGASKAAATLICQQMAMETGLPSVVLRLFSVYGPWETSSRLVPTVMQAMLTGRPVRLTRRGIRRDFVFISDVVDACLRAAGAATSTSEVVNIGSGVEIANEELVDLAQLVTGVRVTVVPNEYPGRLVDAEHWCADPSKAQRVLGWAPAHTLARGLAETWQWTRDRAEFLATLDAGDGR